MADDDTTQQADDDDTPDDAEEATADTPESTDADAGQDATSPDDDTDGPDDGGDGEDALGPKGQKALDALKADRKRIKRERDKEREAREALEAKLAELEQANMSENERREAEAEARGFQKAVEKHRDTALRRLVKAVAMPRFADPDDALHLLDLSELDPDDDDGIEEALSDLLARKPHLAKPAPDDPKPKPKDQGASRELKKAAVDPSAMSVDEYAKWRGIGQDRQATISAP